MPTDERVPIAELAGLVEWDRRAVEATVELVEQWSPVQRELPTPCTGWTVVDLLAHMTVQQRGFARAVSGDRTALAEWAPAVEADPIGAYRDACAAVLRAFAALSDPAAPVLLPEIREEPLPTAVVVGFHLVDNVVHAWDFARTLGTEVSFDDEVLAAALAVARAVPDDEGRERADAAFAHRLPVPEGTSALAQTLLLLGRDPEWAPV